MKLLPTDVSSLSTMISKNYLYIDKTEYIYNLLKSGSRFYFLSRPRRFGKSLLVSTLQEIFLANKTLFKDLWLGQSDYAWQEYPVIKLDFSQIPHFNEQELRDGLNDELITIARNYGIIDIQKNTPEQTLKELVLNLAKKNHVVILIDEYDKPILDHLQDIEQARKQQKVLSSFYTTIKSLEQHLHFVFLTGVSRFAKTSIFSGINNLNDISLKHEAAALLGYTEEEIHSYFEPYIQGLAQKYKSSIQTTFQELQRWYNGYRFSEGTIKVYNPFSILYCLKDKKFSNYWFASGTPTFLIHLLNQQYDSLEEMSNIQIDRDSLDSFELDKIPLVPLLFQTGYLTISDYNEKTNIITLHLPNQEVTESFTKFLVSILAQTTTSTVKKLSLQLIEALEKQDLETFCKLLQTFFAHIPYSLHIKKESFYHALVQALFTLLSIEAQSEIATDKGRIDLVLNLEKTIFLFEFKFNSSAKAALKQIREKRYYERYTNKNKPIILVGLSFKQADKIIHLEYEKQDLAL